MSKPAGLRPSTRILIAVTVFALCFGTLAWAVDDDDPRLVNPRDSYSGLTYGEWAAAFWQWAYSIPCDAHSPLLPGGDVTLGQAGHHVFFLTGTSGPKYRYITIDSKTALYVPIVNNECSTLEDYPGSVFFGADQPALASCANRNLDPVTNIRCEIDGMPIKKPTKYREQSPMFVYLNLPNPNCGGPVADPAKAYYAVDAGYAVIVKPLSVGQHTIHIGGTFPQTWGFTVDTTYFVTVNP